MKKNGASGSVKAAQTVVTKTPACHGLLLTGASTKQDPLLATTGKPRAFTAVHPAAGFPQDIDDLRYGET